MRLAAVVNILFCAAIMNKDVRRVRARPEASFGFGDNESKLAAHPRFAACAGPAEGSNGR